MEVVAAGFLLLYGFKVLFEAAEDRGRLNGAQTLLTILVGLLIMFLGILVASWA